MSSTQQQGSNDTSKCKDKQTNRTRRVLTDREEEVLLASLKELVAQGWKSDNGFRAGYLKKLEDAMKKEFPGTDLKAVPNLNSKITTWKKNYYSLSAMLRRSGVGFNLNGTHMIDCNNEQWEQIIKMDDNAKSMRYRSWPLMEDWKQIFGKDRATGDNAEDVMEAVHELLHEENGVRNEDYVVNLEEIFENDAPENSVCQSEKGESVQRQTGKKRKQTDGIEGLYNLLGQISRKTDARLENIASRIGYEFDLGQAKKDAFLLLSDIPGLTLNDKFDICEILAHKTERLEIFMGLPEDARPHYAMRLLNSKKE